MAKNVETRGSSVWQLRLDDPHAAGAIEFYIGQCQRAQDDESADKARPYLEAAREAARRTDVAQEPPDPDTES